MQIIIPMSGAGQRFQDVGYKTIKPLIEVDGRPIIEHVVNMFPGEANFAFICNEDHLGKYPVEETLKRIAPKGKILPIASHKKGPVYAVSQVLDHIDMDDETIVNYCDFYTYWNYPEFKKLVKAQNAAGAIPSYRGFHPHMLGSDNYAFLKSNGQWMKAIQEKMPFTDNRMAEYASSGTYYFAKGAYVRKYFQQLMAETPGLNGEYYVSLVFNLLAQDQLPVFIYEIQHMLQWGTPKDLQEYERWSAYFQEAIRKQAPLQPEPNSVTVIPMAGEGRRFAEQGYKDPKPMIPVSGLPMVIQATNSLPPTENYRFVCRSHHLTEYPLEKTIQQYSPKAEILSVEKLTEGQACTCEIGLQGVEPEAPLLIGACDNGMLIDTTKYQALISDPKVDGVIFTFRHHPASAANPQMYGWVKVDAENTAECVSVKIPISDTPKEDHAIVGAFYFKKTKYFQEALKALVQKNIRVNNEFYVDSLMNEMILQNHTVKVFEVEHYLCWGTPSDYETFVYWQSFFHKCDWHPYALAQDPTVPKDQVAKMDQQYHQFIQPNPERVTCV